MSGIYIYGMEMPDGCLLCPLMNGQWQTCKLLGDDVDVPLATRRSDCPLILVPDHGRLGDLDELEKTFREDADVDWNRFAAPINWADAFDDVADIVADAPTVIPADKEIRIK